MGEVFLAQDTELDRYVALKVMSAELAGDANQRKRFRTEAKAASGLVHPNICVIHEVGETDQGRPFLAMEYVEGQTLDVLLQQRRLKLREVIRIGIEVAEALDTAHTQGIVHRDIKTSNLMLDSHGRVKVLDFGLAKRLLQDELSLLTSSAAHTRTGMLIGTPHYMSPEQMLGREVDHRTDIFSLGVVMYELVVGQKPFLGRTVGETINSVVNQPAQPLGLDNPVFSPALDSIILKCLEKDPEKRYASAKELAADLKRLQQEAERALDASDEPLVPCRPVPGSCQPATPLWNLPQEHARSAKLVWVISGLLLAIAVGFLGFGYWKSRPSAPGTGRPGGSTASVPAKSVAVLPFDNFSPEPGSEYLSDGLTEEITTALSRVGGLKVAARNSAFAFKGNREDIRKIGEALGVSTLLEGSVRKVGKQIRVTAQLINAADGFHLWSETYDRSVDDIIALQDEVAQRIVERLQGGKSPPRLDRKPVDPEAHDLYLRARLFWNKRDASSLERSIALFQQAIKLDPDYAAAQAGLAGSYFLLPLYSPMIDCTEYRKLSRAAAQRALELDPTSAEAHAVLGQLQSAVHDLSGAEQHFRRALELAPNFATAHQWYGFHLNVHGRWQEGSKELEKAAELDPLSPVIRASIAEWEWRTGDPDRGIAEIRKVITIFPDFVIARHVLVMALLSQRRFEEGLREIEDARKLQPTDEFALLDMRAFALARLGRQEEARQILGQYQQLQAQGKKLASKIFMVYLGLRDYDKAIDALELVDKEEPISDAFLQDPFTKELRGVPRFEVWLKKKGLKD